MTMQKRPEIAANPLLHLRDYGQSVWLDFLSRRFIESGDLKALVERDGLAGVTSNPSIFEKAVAGSDDYDAALKAAIAKGDRDVMALYEELAIADIQHAADVLRPVYRRTEGRDGFVSLEVSPYIAMDTEATLAEARRLWRTVARDNLMIKVPATKAGLPAIAALIADGINVNITLLFSQKVYGEVAEAYIDGLEHLIVRGGDAGKVASVASFFVSRIDTAVDKMIDDRIKAKPAEREVLGNLRGKIAIANARLAYQSYKQLFSGPRWDRLRAKGAHPQRLLWASTGVKDKAYRDVLYVEELIAPDTVNTLPPATMDAFRDHGQAAATLDHDVAQARQRMVSLDRAGISIDAVTDGLVTDGVQLFADAFDRLLGAVARKRAACLGHGLNGFACKLPAGLEKDVADQLHTWRRAGNTRRLWSRDATLWTGADESRWLGWLDIVGAQEKRLDEFAAWARGIRPPQFRHVVLLGMGGSSLGPEVLAETYGAQAGHPQLLVLDSTDPAQIRAIESEIDIERTLFLVSSKSGTTLEPNILKQYFFDRAASALGPARAGAHFVAITDPGSKLQQEAEREGFRSIAYGKADIGGRYSVMSDFGMVPAALMGLDVQKFLASAQVMVRSCGADVPPTENPGVLLGVILGTLAKHGHDKLTIIASPGLADFGAWLEQLVAESTGKLGKGLIPVDAEPLGRPSVYGRDRLFAYLRLGSGAISAQDDFIVELEKAGHPVVMISLADRYGLAQEFVRWEFATAVAGSVIGINPFDQPDVEASKVKTRDLTAAYERTGSLPAETPLFEDRGIKVFADKGNAQALAGSSGSLVTCLKAHFSRAGEGDYFALLAYIARNAAHGSVLGEIRRLIRDRRYVATCLGFGPRFLHSTGQAYKGGPNSGVFLQITSDDAADLAVPRQTYTFGIAKAAQARGDLDVLAERGRRALRVHLGRDVGQGLATLAEAVREALDQ